METPASNLNPATDSRRKDLMQKAVDSWGTAIILERRAKRYQGWIKASSFVGFITPLVVGVSVAAFGANWAKLSSLLLLVGFVSGGQVLVSGVLIFLGLETKLKQVQDSASINKMYAEQADVLAKNVRLPDVFFTESYLYLLGQINAHTFHDGKLGFSPKELRVAARAGFKRFNQKCGMCDLVPATADAKVDKSKCKNCGNI